MSSLINKAKAKVEELADRNQNKADNPQSSNAGPHSSGMMNKADPTIDSDRDHRNDPTSRVGGYGNTQTADQYGTAQGPGGVATTDTYGSTGNHPGYDHPRSDNYGPHSSNLMNKADPRVDSDRDGRNDPTSRVGGVGNTQQYGDNYGQAGGPGGIATSNTGYGTQPGHTGDVGYTGPTGHSGPVGRVEHSGYTGRAGGLSEAAAAGTGTTGAGTSYGTGPGDTYDNPRSSNTGPHSSNLLNKLDPRHDSDRDHRNDPTSRVGGYGTQGDDYGRAGVHEATTHPSGTGLGTGTGGGYGVGTTGSYGSAQPGIQGGGHGVGTTESYGSVQPGIQGGGHGVGTTESYGSVQPGVQGAEHHGHHGHHGHGHGQHGHQGTHGAGATTGTAGYGDSSYTPGSGNAPNTAGPHNSDMLNKIDPRVDSDLDGSKTYGGNQTYR